MRDRAAETDEFFVGVYEDLLRVAGIVLRKDRTGTVMDATALVHEAYLRIRRQDVVTTWRDRQHFLAVSIQVMRRILIDDARNQRAKERGDNILCLFSAT